MTFTVLLVIIGTESQKGWLFVLYFTFYIHCFSLCICGFFYTTTINTIGVCLGKNNVDVNF